MTQNPIEQEALDLARKTDLDALNAVFEMTRHIDDFELRTVINSLAKAASCRAYEHGVVVAKSIYKS
jgi:hypothetical protein